MDNLIHLMQEDGTRPRVRSTLELTSAKVTAKDVLGI